MQTTYESIKNNMPCFDELDGKLTIFCPAISQRIKSYAIPAAASRVFMRGGSFADFGVAEACAVNPDNLTQKVRCYVIRRYDKPITEDEAQELCELLHWQVMDVLKELN